MKLILWKDGAEHGPYDQATLETYLISGEMPSGTLARFESETDWKPLESLLPSLAKLTEDPAILDHDKPAPPVQAPTSQTAPATAKPAATPFKTEWWVIATFTVTFLLQVSWLGWSTLRDIGIDSAIVLSAIPALCIGLLLSIVRLFGKRAEESCQTVSGRRILPAFLLCLLFWWIGVHRMYCGHFLSGIVIAVFALGGIIYLTEPGYFHPIGALSLALAALWATFDLIIILVGKMRDGAERSIKLWI